MCRPKGNGFIDPALRGKSNGKARTVSCAGIDAGDMFHTGLLQRGIHKCRMFSNAKVILIKDPLISRWIIHTNIFIGAEGVA